MLGEHRYCTPHVHTYFELDLARSCVDRLCDVSKKSFALRMKEYIRSVDHDEREQHYQH